MSDGLFGSFGISASGMTATRLQMDVVAENLANADSTSGPDGKPYERKEVVLQAAPSFADALSSAGGQGGGGQSGGGVQVSGIVDDPSPGQQVYDPSNPDANSQGYVTMPNVDPVTEMTDMINATRGYEANVQALDASKQMFSKTLDILS
jgi:flagellar basal-body rod protein FlgC